MIESHVALLRGINIGGRNKLPIRNWKTVLKLDELAGLSRRNGR